MSEDSPHHCQRVALSPFRPTSEVSLVPFGWKCRFDGRSNINNPSGGQVVFGGVLGICVDEVPGPIWLDKEE